MKNLLITLSAIALAPAISHAAITMFAEYHLGEAGSLGATNRPQDSSGNGRNFGGANAAAGAVVTTGLPSAAIGSTAALDTSNTGSAEGWYNADSTGLGTDDYAFGIFAKAAQNTATERGTVFMLNGDIGGYNITLGANGWEASAYNIAYISQPTAFTANTWAHLAMIRTGGVTTFYIDGIAQAGTYATASTLGQMQISVSPGGSTAFDGWLDEARVVQFTAGESTTNILNALTGASAIPEPSTYGLLGAGALAGVAIVRRRRRR